MQAECYILAKRERKKAWEVVGCKHDLCGTIGKATVVLHICWFFANVSAVVAIRINNGRTVCSNGVGECLHFEWKCMELQREYIVVYWALRCR